MSLNEMDLIATATTVLQKDSSAFPTLSTDRKCPVSKTGKEHGPSGLWWLMAVPTFVIAGYSLFFFTGMSPGDPEIKNRILNSTGGIVRISGALLTLAVGPFQFLNSLR
ncbi:hypothetical protein B0J13DRAFT_533867 [Dactylonectria estremocensis]|uniref:Uncharacterized protein n=1 Tax=Dactylonectria estremocensis TaxID=1079267 RepID=A0A9P9D6P3_9HYPO|nr:hypothetical protein B0J13DRAFT_533867 [Dactylonectria estremocensis]